MEPCSEKQAAILSDNGYNPDDYNKREASDVIDQIYAERAAKRNGATATKPARQRTKAAVGAGSRSSRGPSGGEQSDPYSVPCTEKQADILERFGKDPGQFSKGSASEYITALAENKWQPLDEDEESLFS